LDVSNLDAHCIGRGPGSLLVYVLVLGCGQRTGIGADFTRYSFCLHLRALSLEVFQKGKRMVEQAR